MSLNRDFRKQVNNLVARIKSNYPNLYKETGGRYVRMIVRSILEISDDRPRKSETNETAKNMETHYTMMDRGK